MVSSPRSPSLRGSGLKSQKAAVCQCGRLVSLFTREWIEIRWAICTKFVAGCLPLYEGVDWNHRFAVSGRYGRASPSLRGSGLKSPVGGGGEKWWLVSLFTREWIEIYHFHKERGYCNCLPLYEGVDWNLQCRILKALRFCLPLYEGVDWNFKQRCICFTRDVSLFTREWIEIILLMHVPEHRQVSLFTREWIEIILCPDPYWYSRVSLFTREWIEIAMRLQAVITSGRLPLYEGVDWNKVNICHKTTSFRLPLYEGVDWNCGCQFQRSRNKVSLFTREWIEIKTKVSPAWALRASPSLRGSGLKCQNLVQRCHGLQRSPSLRGSGLKSKIGHALYNAFWSLPLYEGVDWNLRRKLYVRHGSCLPLYEGVDWNCVLCGRSCSFCVSLFTREWIEIKQVTEEYDLFLHLPLYEGVDWNEDAGVQTVEIDVSLFTREWIEIERHLTSKYRPSRLPLYEGVDWNSSSDFTEPNVSSLPLYEGVDWNHRCSWLPVHQQSVSLFTREWIEINLCNLYNTCCYVSLFTREWIEMYFWWDNVVVLLVSLFTREWIEMALRQSSANLLLSPSLRGSGLKLLCILFDLW